METKLFEKYCPRLSTEIDIMKRQFPKFVFIDDNDRLYWKGVIITDFGTHYVIEITYPPRYPDEYPIFNIIEPEVKNGFLHHYVSGNICVYPENWDRKKCTAPAGVPILATWLTIYEDWCQNGERDHRLN